MFDLFRSRDKAVRIMLTAILSLVALSMITYLVPGSGTTGAMTNNNIVAEVGKNNVTVRDVQIAIRNARRQRDIDPAMWTFIVPQMVDEMINEKVLIYEAERLGIRVTEADTAKAIRNNMPQLFPDGQFIGKEAYAAALAQQESTISEFEDFMRQRILLERLRSVILESIVVSKADIEREFRTMNEKTTIEYAKILPEKIQAEVKVSPEEMRAYYEKNKAGLRIPDKRSMKLIVLDPAVMSDSVAVSDQQIRAAYEQRKDSYRIPDRVKARHILLMTSGKPPDEEAKIKAQAADILKQLKAGGNFAELATKYSEDPGSKTKGGDLDWITPQQDVDPEFKKVLFELKPKETSGLVKSQFGYHIIQVLEKESARLKPFEEVKAELTAELKKQVGQRQIQTTMDSVVAALKKNPQQVDQIAAQYHLSAVNVDKAGAGDPVPELGVNRDFEDSVMSLKKGEVSQPVAAPGDRMIVAVITDVFPAHQASFEESEQQIRPLVTNEKTERVQAQRAAELVAKVKAMNGDFKKAAQSMGLEVVTPPEFARRGAVEGIGSPDMIPEVLSKPVGTVFGPTRIGTALVVGKVVARTPANMFELPAQVESIRDDLKRSRARERNTLFEDGIRQQLMKEGTIKIHQDVLKRLISGENG